MIEKLKNLCSLDRPGPTIWLLGMLQWKPTDRFGHVEKWTYLAFFFGGVLFFSMLSTDIAIALGYVRPWSEQ